MYNSDCVLHWSRQTEVRQYAFPPEYSPDSTCQWQGHMADRAALPVTDKTGFECTGISVKHTHTYVQFLLL